MQPHCSLFHANQLLTALVHFSFPYARVTGMMHHKPVPRLHFSVCVTGDATHRRWTDMNKWICVNQSLRLGDRLLQDGQSGQKSPKICSIFFGSFWFRWNLDDYLNSYLRNYLCENRAGISGPYFKVNIYTVWCSKQPRPDVPHPATAGVNSADEKASTSAMEEVDIEKENGDKLDDLDDAVPQKAAYFTWRQQATAQNVRKRSYSDAPQYPPVWVRGAHGCLEYTPELILDTETDHVMGHVCHETPPAAMTGYFLEIFSNINRIKCIMQ